MEPSHDIAREKHRPGHAREENNVLVLRRSESRVNCRRDVLHRRSDILVRVKYARDWMLAKLHDETTNKRLMDERRGVFRGILNFLCGFETKFSLKNDYSLLYTTLLSFLTFPLSRFHLPSLRSRTRRRTLSECYSYRRERDRQSRS